MAKKNEDMLKKKDYNQLKAAEEGEERKWIAVYVEGLKRRAATALEKRRPNSGAYSSSGLGHGSTQGPSS